MKEKLIYDNTSSDLKVTFDGEIVTLIQTFEGENIGNIAMYLDEFEKLVEFAKECKED